MKIINISRAIVVSFKEKYARCLIDAQLQAHLSTRDLRWARATPKGPIADGNF